MRDIFDINVRTNEQTKKFVLRLFHLETILPSVHFMFYVITYKL